MKKLSFIFSLILILLTGSCKKRVNIEPPAEKGYVKLYINNQLVFDEEGTNINYISARRFIGFNFSEGSTIDLSGGITNVPQQTGGTNAILSGTPQEIINNADSSPLSFVQLHSDTQNIVAPGGQPVQNLISNGGEVRRESHDLFIAEGNSYEITDPANPVTYQFKLEVKIKNFQ